MIAKSSRFGRTRVFLRHNLERADSRKSAKCAGEKRTGLGGNDCRRKREIPDAQHTRDEHDRSDNEAFHQSSRIRAAPGALDESSREAAERSAQ